MLKNKAEENTIDFVPSNATTKKIIIIAIPILIAVIILCSSITVVPAGHTGVAVTLGKVSDNVLTEGLHFKAPLIQTVIKMSNQIQKSEIDGAESVSKDLQAISSTIVVNYKVGNKSSAEIYRNIGKDYEAIVLLPAIHESLKAVTAKYTAEELVTLRSQVAIEIEETLQEKMGAYGIVIDKFNIVNFSFSEEFAKAIEAKEVAAQNLLKAKTEQQQVIVEANAEAEKKVIAAEAEAKAILAKAEAQAEANEKLSKSLTSNIIENSKIEKWNGELPMATGGSSIIDMRTDKTSSETE